MNQLAMADGRTEESAGGNTIVQGDRVLSYRELFKNKALT